MGFWLEGLAETFFLGASVYNRRDDDAREPQRDSTFPYATFIDLSRKKLNTFFTCFKKIRSTEPILDR
jgi:hypothetical protein